MSNEILSKRTIAVLLVLSMLLSVFGTLAVLNYLDSYRPVTVAQAAQAKQSNRAGQLSLEIVQPQKQVISTGYVALDIQKVEG